MDAREKFIEYLTLVSHGHVRPRPTQIRLLCEICLDVLREE